MKPTPPKDAEDAFVRLCETKGLTRRALISRGLAMGLSLPSIAGLLAACSSSSTGSSSSAAFTKGKPGGTLREGYNLDFSRMDPVNTQWYDPSFNAMYEGLVTLDRNHKFVPQLAESWTTSPDGLSWTFTLKPSARFHSGAPVTGATVAAVFGQILKPTSGSSILPLLAPIKRVEATGPRTVVFHLSAPYADLLNAISTGYSVIYNPEMRQALGNNYGKSQIDGTGPFTFVEWVPSDHVTVKRWKEYPGSLVPFFENKGPAYLDGITWKYIGQAANRALQLGSGEIDSVRGPAPQDVARLKNEPNIIVSEATELSYYFLGLNFNNEAFRDIRVRQAVAHAIDREAIVERLVFGHGAANYGPLPASDPFYNRAVENYNRYDVKAAKALLAEAGWTPGPDGVLTKGGMRLDFPLVVTNESFQMELATVLQSMLRGIGLQASIQSYDQATWYSKVGAGAGVPAFIYYALWPFPMDVYIQFAAATAIGLSNWMHARIPEVDKSIAAYQAAKTEAELEAAVKNAQIVGAQQLPYIPIFAPSSIYAHRTNVHNYMVIPWDLYPYYNDVWMG